MNFQYIKKVETSQTIIDVSFKSAKEKGEETWLKFRKTDKLTRTKHAEEDRVKTVRRKIVGRLAKITDQFPRIEELPEIYRELIKNNLDVFQYNMSLDSIKWTSSKIETLYVEFIEKIRRQEDTNRVIQLRNRYYARCSSLLEKVSKKIELLNTVRDVLRKLPDIKDDIFTIAIAGYPNVGKSSLLKTLTKTNPKIANYSFTTKNLNVGYLGEGKNKIQMIDVPGTFDRDIKDMNMVEKNAMIIIEKIAQHLIFIIDASEYCGYSIKEQIGLLENLKRFNTPLTIVINKIDITEKDKLKEAEENLKGTDFIKISTTENKGLKNLIKVLREKD